MKKSAGSTRTTLSGGNLPSRFLMTFIKRWDKFNLELANCRGEFSEASVHDLRVATRRLVACLDMARALDPHPRLQKMRRALKSQIDELDDLRDCQVMLTELAESAESHPELTPLHDHLLANEQRLLRKARKQIKNLKLSALQKRFEKIRASLEEQLARPEAETELLQAVDQAYETATKRYVQIDAAHPASIHRLRLAFKKFRYRVEIIHPALLDFPEDLPKRMHDYQSLMGEVQDAVSFLNLLEETAEEDSSFDPEPARRYFEGLRTERTSAYLDDKGELLVFWRPAPNQPFPWQASPTPKGDV
ncbi:MAG: CHAD domain-containing protein [Chloroflexi bacterium]|nr:CHAD domain-containing protein [Chloroflexota bacterium]